jgi:hypothetical protein
LTLRAARPEEAAAMPTRHEYAKQPITRRLERLARTAGELAAIRGRTDGVLSRRPDSKDWAAKEIVCHLRDIEELFRIRFRTMLAIDEPKFLVLGEMPHDPAPCGIIAGDPLPLDPDRWAAERQSLRNETGEALRWEETVAFLRRLTPEQWKRGSIHVTLGRMTLEDWVALIAAHDDNHSGPTEARSRGQSVSCPCI